MYRCMHAEMKGTLITMPKSVITTLSSPSSFVNGVGNTVDTVCYCNSPSLLLDLPLQNMKWLITAEIRNGKQLKTHEQLPGINL